MLPVPWKEPRPLVVDGAGALWLDTAAGLGRTPPGQGPEAGWELVEAHGPAAGVRLAARLLDGTVVVAVEHLHVHAARAELGREHRREGALASAAA